MVVASEAVFARALPRRRQTVVRHLFERDAGVEGSDELSIEIAVPRLRCWDAYVDDHWRGRVRLGVASGVSASERQDDRPSRLGDPLRWRLRLAPVLVPHRLEERPELIPLAWARPGARSATGLLFIHRLSGAEWARRCCDNASFIRASWSTRSSNDEISSSARSSAFEKSTSAADLRPE